MIDLKYSVQKFKKAGRGGISGWSSSGDDLLYNLYCNKVLSYQNKKYL